MSRYRYFYGYLVSVVEPQAGIRTENCRTWGGAESHPTTPPWQIHLLIPVVEPETGTCSYCICTKGVFTTDKAEIIIFV